jgi:hypothetical protein
MTQARAYQNAGYPDQGVESSQANGARLEKRPEVAARIAYLKAQRAKLLPGAGDPHVEVTRESMRAKIGAAFQLASEPGEIAQLSQTLLKVHPELASDPDTSRPDPCAIVAYVASFAGMRPEQVARELGGVKFIAQKLCHVTKIPPGEFLDVFTALAEEAKRGNGSDGEPEADAGAMVPSDKPEPPSVPDAVHVPGPETPEPPSATATDSPA